MNRHSNKGHKHFQSTVPAAAPDNTAYSMAKGASESDIKSFQTRRFCARLMDTIIYTYFFLFFFFPLINDFLPKPFDTIGKAITGVDVPTMEQLKNPADENKLIDRKILLFTVFFSLIMSIIPSAFVIGFSKTSIGKYIFGIKIENNIGEPIGFFKALLREFYIWLWGFGLGILAPITLAQSAKKLKTTESTKWDDKLGIIVRYRKNGFNQTLLSAIGFIILAPLVGLIYQILTVSR